MKALRRSHGQWRTTGRLDVKVSDVLSGEAAPEGTTHGERAASMKEPRKAFQAEDPEGASPGGIK